MKAIEDDCSYVFQQLPNYGVVTKRKELSENGESNHDDEEEDGDEEAAYYQEQNEVKEENTGDKEEYTNNWKWRCWGQLLYF